ncbi:3'-5' exonuclease [Asticcacaulis sp. AND118]|uniref:3'-5' exonuclease n=1 Tax=Asticcacaulis sp. AND118 TaxID=2840468 RepID=UPI001CFFD3BD|nr:3'-5' exonuclease [Asticcacaulis sp. AND118]UDF04057.1 3'-5' exonuclease [Asticcacaulis sp. AND118]
MTSQLDMFGVTQPLASTAAPTRKRPRPLAKALLTLEDDEALAAHLEGTGRYRILRKLEPKPVVDNPRPGFPHIAVIVDTETTGLKKAEDEIIEIGLIAIRFNEVGQVGDVIGTYGALQAPSRPIPADITALTGIDDAMVLGQSINLRAVEDMVASADLIIAHNAAFDRPFCERLSPEFASKAWACSNAEIDWKARGFEGSKLGYLVSQAGYFHDGHRALDDCFALLAVLDRQDADARSAFAELFASSQKARVRLWAEYSPFDKKDVLKARGYRWSSGDDGGPKAWWTEVDAEDLDAEVRYLQTDIYQRADVEPTTRYLTAMERFKA